MLNVYLSRKKTAASYLSFSYGLQIILILATVYAISQSQLIIVTVLLTVNLVTLANLLLAHLIYIFFNRRYLDYKDTLRK